MIFKVAARDGGTREGIIAQSLPRKAVWLAACGGLCNAAALNARRLKVARYTIGELEKSEHIILESD